MPKRSTRVYTQKIRLGLANASKPQMLSEYLPSCQGVRLLSDSVQAGIQSRTLEENNWIVSKRNRT